MQSRERHNQYNLPGKVWGNPESCNWLTKKPMTSTNQTASPGFAYSPFRYNSCYLGLQPQIAAIIKKLISV